MLSTVYSIASYKDYIKKHTNIIVNQINFISNNYFSNTTMAEFIEVFINIIKWIVILGVIGVIINWFFSRFVVILEPYQGVIKERFGKYSEKQFVGGYILKYPWDRILPVSTEDRDFRQRTLWIGFWGPRGRNTHTFQFINNYQNQIQNRGKEAKGILKRGAFEEDIKDAQIYTDRDFIQHGPMVTNDQIELNILLSLQYQVFDIKNLIETVGELSYRNSISAKVNDILRSKFANVQLDELFVDREKLLSQVISELEEITLSWGIKILNLSIEDLFLEDEALQDQLDERKVTFYEGEINKVKEEWKNKIGMVRSQMNGDIRKINLEKEAEIKAIETEAHNKIAKINLEIAEYEAELKKEESEIKATLEVLSGKYEGEKAKAIKHAIKSNPTVLKIEAVNRMKQTLNNFSSNNSTPEIINSLLSVYTDHDTLPEVRAEILNTLIKLNAIDAIPTLLNTVKNENLDIEERLIAIKSIATFCTDDHHVNKISMIPDSMSSHPGFGFSMGQAMGSTIGNKEEKNK